jgi:hypothetical protein
MMNHYSKYLMEMLDSLTKKEIKKVNQDGRGVEQVGRPP